MIEIEEMVREYGKREKLADDFISWMRMNKRTKKQEEERIGKDLVNLIFGEPERLGPRRQAVIRKEMGGEESSVFSPQSSEDGGRGTGERADARPAPTGDGGRADARPAPTEKKTKKKQGPSKADVRFCESCVYWKWLSGAECYACHYAIDTDHVKKCGSGVKCKKKEVRDGELIIRERDPQKLQAGGQ